MKPKRARQTSKPRPANNGAVGAGRVELGEYIVADPLICHGKPTFKGTRIMVWQILDDLSRGESIDQIVAAWGGLSPCQSRNQSNTPGQAGLWRLDARWRNLVLPDRPVWLPWMRGRERNKTCAKAS